MTILLFKAKLVQLYPVMHTFKGGGGEHERSHVKWWTWLKFIQVLKSALFGFSPSIPSQLILKYAYTLDVENKICQINLNEVQSSWFGIFCFLKVLKNWPCVDKMCHMLPLTWRPLWVHHSDRHISHVNIHQLLSNNTHFLSLYLNHNIEVYEEPIPRRKKIRWITSRYKN